MIEATVTVSGSEEGAGGRVADGGCVAPGDVVEADAAAATDGVARPEAFGDFPRESLRSPPRLRSDGAFAPGAAAT